MEKSLKTFLGSEKTNKVLQKIVEIVLEKIVKKVLKIVLEKILENNFVF